jgi:hypothetical protein
MHERRRGVAEIRTDFFSRDTPKQAHRRWQRILVSVGLRSFL